MYTKHFFLLAVTLVAVNAAAIFGRDETQTETEFLEIGQVFTLNMAIVCDYDFGLIFQHNRSAILEYWAVFVKDMQHQFHTLKSSNISIRVTSVSIIEWFIEETRDKDGQVPLANLLDEFSKWMYDYKEHFADFDLALAVTAVPTVNTTVGRIHT